MTVKFRYSQAVINNVLAILKEQLGERLMVSAAIREQHAQGESWHAPYPPEAVVFPDNTAEVAMIVRTCADAGVPIIPYGAGTSIEGHLGAVEGGISIDMSWMDQVLAVHEEDLDCRVQAGVTRKQLNEHLRSSGLFFPIDPGADATLGGMAATRASGTNAVRYGTMRENVLSLTVVLASGKIITTAQRARKSSAGYDLTRLMVGSEGTLGIITEVGVRLYGMPEAISAAIVNFPSVAKAVSAVIDIIRMGVPVARIELLDDYSLYAINRYSKTNFPEKDTLFLEFHGTETGVKEQAEIVADITQEHGGGDFDWVTREEDRNKMWAARHTAYYAALALKPGCKGWSTDVCVPISKLAECIAETKKDLEATFFKAPIIGHVGDGNFHMLWMMEEGNQAHIDEATRLNGRLVKRALTLGGTCTGEHGVGVGKLKYLRAEHGDDAVETMQAIKQALDPRNIMNPGKTVDC